MMSYDDQIDDILSELNFDVDVLSNAISFGKIDDDIADDDNHKKVRSKDVCTPQKNRSRIIDLETAKFELSNMERENVRLEEKVEKLCEKLLQYQLEIADLRDTNQLLDKSRLQSIESLQSLQLDCQSTASIHGNSNSDLVVVEFKLAETRSMYARVSQQLDDERMKVDALEQQLRREELLRRTIEMERDAYSEVYTGIIIKQQELTKMTTPSKLNKIKSFLS